MAKSRPLIVETLEDRIARAAIGLPWRDPTHLTLSFAPDGTSIAGDSSDLFQDSRQPSSPPPRPGRTTSSGPSRPGRRRPTFRWAWWPTTALRSASPG